MEQTVAPGALPRRLRSPGPMLPVSGEQDFAPRGVGIARRIRAARRTAGVLAFTAGAAGVQSVLLMLPGRAKVRFARTYWAGLCWLIGLRVRVVGTPARGPGGRAVVFVSNHSSWLDVLSLGGTLEAVFVAKEEVGRWPVVRTVARLGRTVFVSRRPRDTGRERNAMRARMAAGDSLLLFPEGTSNDGSRVLPFRSAFFSVCEGEAAPLIQPVSVVYDRIGGMPIGRPSRTVFAWFGNMELAGHVWKLTQHRGLRATVLLHPPINPADYPSRKALASAVWQTVADGAAALRQNRLPA